LPPQAVAADALAAALLAELPAERVGEPARQAANSASLHWPDRFTTVQTWFEAGEAIDALLRPIRAFAKRLDAVGQYLPRRRAFWAELCAWTAALLKESEPLNPEWIDFALIARDLAGQRPLDQIALAGLITTGTVAAYEASRSRH
jgi:hypothetical protein